MVFGENCPVRSVLGLEVPDKVEVAKQLQRRVDWLDFRIYQKREQFGAEARIGPELRELQSLAWCLALIEGMS
jgi:hypothetical protein